MNFEKPQQPGDVTRIEKDLVPGRLDYISEQVIKLKSVLETNPEKRQAIEAFITDTLFKVEQITSSNIDWPKEQED